MKELTWLSDDDPPDAFPPTETALRDPNGLLAAGGDLTAERLIAAYRRGIFPWYSRGQPILWWTPDPRAVLYPADLKVSRSLQKSLRTRGFATRMDTDFESVMRACGDRTLRPEGTWISPAMRTAYSRLHELGYAHSVEIFLADQLVGGLYGVALGKIFYGESMFSRVTDASKVALKALCDQLLQRQFVLIDCQMTTAHLQSLGATTLSRAKFNAVLAEHAQPPDPIGRWS